MSDINKVLVLDDRLHCTDQLNFAVQKGASSLTYSQFNAVSATPNQINFNVQVPSQESLISRDIYIQADLTFVITIPQVVNDAGMDEQNLKRAIRFQYGKCDALAPFPLHQLITTANTTINNNTTTMNTRDVLPVLLRMLNPEALQKYEATTPVLPDGPLYDYNDAVEFNYRQFTPQLVGGQICLVASAAAADMMGSTSYHTNVLGNGQWAHFNGLRGRGCHQLKSITKATNAGTEQYTVVVNVTEPLLMSPWIFRGLVQNNAQAMYGIQNMNFQFTLDPTCQRAWRYADGQTTPYTFAAGAGGGDPTNNNRLIKTYQLTQVENCRLLMAILTPPPELLLPPKNIIPYYELPVYRTSNLPTLPAATINANGSLNFTVVPITSNSLHLSMIPDSLIIYVRRKDLTNKDSDSFACIRSVQIQFDNVAGILVNATQEDLWRMSVENGLNMSWDEFRGSMTGKVKPFRTVEERLELYTAVPTYPIAGRDQPTPAESRLLGEIGVPGYSQVATTGSILVLEFGKDITLPSYYAPSSLGSFNLQVKLDVYNQTTKQPLFANSYELCIITKNSGVICLERGVCSQYLGLLTKSDVLSVSEQVPYKRSDVKRLVGNGWFDSIKSAFMNIAPRLPSVAKSILGHFKDDNHLAKKAHDVLDHLVYGKHKGGSKKIDDHLM